uniref:C-type lectin domain-containing protein n=3 Tax=Cyprinus carpio TaxID=7962 RepID=A0A8C1EBX8_CYPCA
LPTEEMKIFWVALFLSAHCELTLTLNRKHIFINNAKTWSDAQKFCRENYADLSIIDSQEELLRFKNDSKNQRADSTQSWIGLSKPSANGTWVWNDGSDEISMTWRIGQPDSPNTAFCAKSWENRDCSEKLNFVCYKRSG